jgi:hypothetical protein
VKRLARLVSIACASLVVSTVHAANTDPFDFDYEIDASMSERPALIFNDGEKTYIQPRAGQVITADGGHPEGPYVVVDGTPEVIHYSVGGMAGTARWSRANSFIGDSKSGDNQPAAFGFSDRLVLIGSHSALETVRSLRATMPIGSLVKALAPQGWTGSAQKDVDLTDGMKFETHAGENWMQALDRLMTQTGLYADVDFTARHIRLHRDPPKSGALDYPVGAKEKVTPFDVPPALPPTIDASTPEGSLLAEHFGAQAIRDGDDTHTQIRFAAKPAHKLTFATLDGKSLHPHWDTETNVVTIDRADRFVVSDGTARVEVGRIAGTVYDFDKSNAAHLQAVFDEKGSTFFKFADSVVNVNVSDVRHLGTGEQKGRYYRFNGIADQFIVTADGNTVNVVRHREVKYSEKPGSAAS